MNFIEETRELTSNTGYLKHKETGVVYNYAIYLGIYDSIENYEECTQQDYLNFLEPVKQQEELQNQELQDSSDE